MNSLQSYDNLTTKEDVIQYYKKYINILSQSINDIQNIIPRNKKFKTIQDDCLYDINKLLSDSRIQMEQVMNETIWDKLVIAFFGETNAGKSTIIEAFRIKFNDESRLTAIKENGGKGVDGRIVGDGRQDFTQVYEKYDLNIERRPFVMIDVPGIEGKEDNYLEEISTALKQAHLVFYVQGHNKKPDSATIEKIKKYLSNWVDVYSIFNVRGGVSNYDEIEERKVLLTDNVKSIQNSIIEVFKDALSDLYKGNITCQGYLALMSLADFDEKLEKFIKDQKKIIEYFKEREKVEAFSEFDSIVELVKTRTIDFSTHILEANKQKLQSLSKKIYHGVDETIKKQREKLEIITNQLDAFKSSILSIKNDTISTMKSDLYSEQIQFLSALKQSANDIIDDGNSEDEWYNRISHRFSTIISAFEETIEKIFEKKVDQFKERIEIRRKDLDKIIFHDIIITKPEIDIKIDLTDVIKALKFNIKEDLFKGAFKAFSNPISTIINVFNKTDDGRNNAKKLISEKIDGLKSSVTNHINDEVYYLQKAISNETTLIVDSINEEIANIEGLKMDLKKLKDRFQINN